jgi:hypothetical protein
MQFRLDFNIEVSLVGVAERYNDPPIPKRLTHPPNLIHENAVGIVAGETENDFTL